MLNLFNQNADIESAIGEALSANPNKKVVVKDASKALGKAVSNGHADWIRHCGRDQHDCRRDPQDPDQELIHNQQPLTRA